MNGDLLLTYQEKLHEMTSAMYCLKEMCGIEQLKSAIKKAIKEIDKKRGQQQ